MKVLEAFNKYDNGEDYIINRVSNNSRLLNFDKAYNRKSLTGNLSELVDKVEALIDYCNNSDRAKEVGKVRFNKSKIKNVEDIIPYLKKVEKYGELGFSPSSKSSDKIHYIIFKNGEKVRMI